MDQTVDCWSWWWRCVPSCWCGYYSWKTLAVVATPRSLISLILSIIIKATKHSVTTSFICTFFAIAGFPRFLVNPSNFSDCKCFSSGIIIYLKPSSDNVVIKYKLFCPLPLLVHQFFLFRWRWRSLANWPWWTSSFAQSLIRYWRKNFCDSCL